MVTDMLSFEMMWSEAFDTKHSGRSEQVCRAVLVLTNFKKSIKRNAGHMAQQLGFTQGVTRVATLAQL